MDTVQADAIVDQVEQTAPVEQSEAVTSDTPPADQVAPIGDGIEYAPPVDNDHVAPGSTLFTEEEIALNSKPPFEPAPPVDTSSDAFARFRMHWRGGEHRLAMELVKAGRFVEREFDALVDEFPEVIELLNK